MTRRMWIYTIAVVALVMAICTVYAGQRACAADDDDSADDWAAGRVDDDDTIFDLPEPGVL